MSNTRAAGAVLGAIAAVTILLLVQPWLELPEAIIPAITIAFWISSIAMVVVLYRVARADPRSGDVEIEGPAFVRFLFNNSRAGLVWLPIRIFVGFAWLEAGWHKLTGGGWIDGGSALAGFWKAAVAVPDQGRPAITYDWYRDFINFLLQGGNERWFAWVITFGEIAVGLGLIFGVLTGFAAFFGAFMNMSFLLAGSASTNPVMFTLAMGIMLAWRVAGYYGVDRWLLPVLGTPWQPKTEGEARTAQRPALT
jgi:thiosulfate dehydrogenase (quinone) large subunit